MGCRFTPKYYKFLPFFIMTGRFLSVLRQIYSMNGTRGDRAPYFFVALVLEYTYLSVIQIYPIINTRGDRASCF